MTLAEWLHLTGTLVTFLGAIGLGYDLLTGYPNRNRAEIVRTQLHNLKEFKVRMEAEYKKMETSQNAAEIRALIDILNGKFPTTDLENELSKLTGSHDEKSFVYGWLGFWGVTIGFLIEFLLAFIPFFKAHGWLSWLY
jgi:hypothetical protein